MRAATCKQFFKHPSFFSPFHNFSSQNKSRINQATGRTAVNFCSFILLNENVEIYITLGLHGVQRLPSMVKILAPRTLIEMLISEEWEESGGTLVLEVMDLQWGIGPWFHSSLESARSSISVCTNTCASECLAAWQVWNRQTALSLH